MTTRSTPNLASSALAATLTIAFAAPFALLTGVAQAQPPRPVIEREPPINDPAPRSPIDRGDTEKSPVELGKDVKAPPPAPPPPQREPGQIWIGWTFGTGYGWYQSGPLDATPSKSVNSGFAPDTVGHFGPEIGWQYDQRLALSLQTRHQVIPRQITDPTRPGSSAGWAHAILARATYLFPHERYRLYAGGLIGAGNAFRFRVDAQPSADLPSSDTVHGGPGVIGPVVGVIWPVAEKLSLVAELRGMVGFPSWGGMADLNIGVQFDAFHL